MKILVVDDDALTRKAISLVLKADGFDVVTAENSIQAIEAVGREKPDLIICDVIMPGLSGVNLLGILKQLYFHKIPVIVISSLDKADVILASLEFGAEGFMAKPLDFDELLLRIRKLVK